MFRTSEAPETVGRPLKKFPSILLKFNDHTSILLIKFNIKDKYYLAYHFIVNIKTKGPLIKIFCLSNGRVF